MKKNKNLLKEQEKTKVRHEHVSLHNIYESDEAVYSITDFCTGGELFQRIVERGCHTEKDASDLVRQLLEGLAYLHSEGVIIIIFAFYPCTKKKFRLCTRKKKKNLFG